MGQGSPDGYLCSKLPFGIWARNQEVEMGMVSLTIIPSDLIAKFCFSSVIVVF
jgi:hypothetical protein